MAVFKRNEVWYYAFSIRGIRYRKAIPEARTKFQAQQAETKVKDAVFSGRYDDDRESNITLKEFVEKEFLTWSKENKLSYKDDAARSKAILAYFKNKMMREIGRFNVEQFKKERRLSFVNGKLRAPASVDREIQLLSRMFSLAIERGLIKTNPCKGVKILAKDNRVTKYLSYEDEQKLMQHLAGYRAHLRDILEISLSTGMRRTEILTLHKSQIDFLRDSIELTKTKSGKPRSVPVHSDLKPVLQRLCSQAGESGYLFENSKTGKPITTIKTAWRKAIRDAGIPYINFHCAGRHTFGTRAIDNGAPISAVKEVMRHADINTTMRYVHATEEGKRRAVEAAAKGRVESSPATNMPQAEKATA